jgi:hypothetical protein
LFVVAPGPGLTKESRWRLFRALDRRFVVSCLVAFALGVGLTLGAIAVHHSKKTVSASASSPKHDRRHRGGTRSVSWTKAQQKFARCKVEAVDQKHSGLVTLTLRKGGQVLTHEPAFGDVVAEVGRVAKRCGQIRLSTS